MSVVSDATVRAALPELLSAARMRQRWAKIAPGSLALHRRILNGYLQTGGPPAGLKPADPGLRDLVRRDLIVMDGANITAAYPFSTAATRHSVQIRGVTIACVCAIDALGSAAIANAGARVTSRCAICDTDIAITVAPDGVSIRDQPATPPVVWAGVVAISGCAAASQCQSMLMFCNRAHLQNWLDRVDPQPHGYALSAEQATQAGAAIFRPFLPPGSGF
jgi:Alkylmercury lyase